MTLILDYEEEKIEISANHFDFISANFEFTKKKSRKKLKIGTKMNS